MMIKSKNFILRPWRMSDKIFYRLERMRKKRHIIDYDSQKTVSISEQDLKQSIMDIQKYADKVKEFIDKKNPQAKLLK